MDVTYWDRWYADMEHHPAKDELEQRHLGLPPHLLSTSMLTWDGLAEVVQALRVSFGEVLLDLAGGRGGYGLEAAGRTGARLIGLDGSAIPLRAAAAQARRLGREPDFRVGRLEETGLPAASVDAVMCIDAVQFADPAVAAYAELRRVLRPGGRVVLTCWVAADPGDPRVPQRLAQVDPLGGLTAAGLNDVEVSRRPQWRAREVAMWQEAAALEPGDDPALVALRDEALQVLGRDVEVHRVLVSATAP